MHTQNENGQKKVIRIASLREKNVQNIIFYSTVFGITAYSLEIGFLCGVLNRWNLHISAKVPFEVRKKQNKFPIMYSEIRTVLRSFYVISKRFITSIHLFIYLKYIYSENVCILFMYHIKLF